MALFSHIERAEIVGANVRSGSPDICYSVLLYYSNGTVELKEGNANDIKPYLAHMKPRNDVEIGQLKSMLGEFEAKLRADMKSDMEQMIQRNLYHILVDVGKRWGV